MRVVLYQCVPQVISCLPPDGNAIGNTEHLGIINSILYVFCGQW